ncbi:MAG: hypothetical protein NWP83_10260 [Spirosomaceae bacterium]|nr:hypothetical protein [Spirosomataceae bacterium]
MTVLLSIPLIAIQFTDQVNWVVSDFIVMALLLFSVGLACEITIRNVQNPKFRVLISLIILIAFMLVWVELSVGIFGTPFGGR